MRNTPRAGRWCARILAGAALLGVFVPAGAADATADHSLRDYQTQRPNWSACDFDARAECASIAVPLDYSQPRGRRLTIAISRIKAGDPARRRGALLSVNGGPDGGGTGLGRALPLRYLGTELHQVYDLIGMDNRGDGASTRLYCAATTNEAPFDSRPPDSAFPVIAADMRRTEEACQRADGGMRQYFNTANAARDVDIVRAVLGERRLSFLGYAYGSFVGAVYGTMFGARLDRHVLDSVRDPDWSWRQQLMAQAVAIRGNVDQWADWTGRRDNRFGLGTSRAAVLSAVERVAAKLAVTPVNGLTRTAFDGMMGKASNRPLWTELADTVHTLDTGGTPPATVPAAPATAENGLQPGTLQAVTCEGANGWPRDLNIYYRDMRDFRAHYPYGAGVTRAEPWVCTFRTFTPVEMPQVARTGFTTGLVVQAEDDPVTAYPGGPAMARRLRDPLVTVADEGGNEIFGVRGNTCVDRLVVRYLVDGVLSPSWQTCPGTPRPDVMPD